MATLAFLGYMARQRWFRAPKVDKTYHVAPVPSWKDFIIHALRAGEFNNKRTEVNLLVGGSLRPSEIFVLGTVREHRENPLGNGGT
jgi:hypothetical protein